MGFWQQTEIWTGHGPHGIKLTIYLKHLGDPAAEHPWRVQIGRPGMHNQGRSWASLEEARAEIERLKASEGTGWELAWKRS